MEDQRKPNGITALLTAAAKVHDEMSAPVGRANRVAPMVPSTDISEQLRQMSETFSVHLSTISNKVDTLAERVDNVEGGPSPPATSTPTSTACSPTTGSKNRTPMEITGTPWWQRDPNERMAFDPDESRIAGNRSEPFCNYFLAPYGILPHANKINSDQ